MRPPFRLLVAMSLWVLGLACTSNDQAPGAAADASSERPVAVVEQSLRPPGTVLAPGVKVQSGSLLVGTSVPLINFYPNPGAPSVQVGWQAVLVVDGGPLDVWGRYVAQLGIAEAAGALRSCTVVVVRPPTKEAKADLGPPAERFLTDPPLDGENRVECAATVGGTVMTLVKGAARCRNSGCDLHSVSHLFIRVEEQRAADGVEQFGTDELRYRRAGEAAADPNAVVEPLPVPTGHVFTPKLEGEFRSYLPEPGDRLDDGLDYFLDGTRAGVLPPRGRSLVAPALLIECNSGLVALVEIPGSAAEAVALFDQADPQDDPLTLLQGTDREGRAWAGGMITTAGGYYLSLVAVQTSDAVSVVLVTECGD